MSDKVQTIGVQPTPTEALKEVVDQGMNHFAPTAPIEPVTVLESTPHDIDTAVNDYVGNVKATEEELQALYTEKGAADALYKQVSSATNMMLDASLELTDKVIDEQVSLIQKVIDDEKAKGELADATAIAQAEQILANVTNFKNEEFRRITVLTDASEKAGELYDYIRAQLTDKKKLVRLYRTPPTDSQVVRACEHMCKIMGILVPMTGANAVVGIETTVTAALSNILNTPKKYDLEDVAKFVYSEELSKTKRGTVLTKAIRFVVRFLAEHVRHFLVKHKTPEDRRVFQFLIVEDAITAITYDEALNPTNRISPTTEGFTQLVSELFKVYFTDIKVNGLK